MVFLIFSIFMKERISLIRELNEGAFEDFHLSKIRRLATSVINATKSALYEERGTVGGRTPNKAVKGEGEIVSSKTSDRISKTLDQYSCRLGQDQSVCAKDAGDE